MSRRTLVIGALVVAVLIAGGLAYHFRGRKQAVSGTGPFGPTQPAGKPSPNDRRPNIVMIMTDDQELYTLRYQHKIQNLLVRNGTLFNDAQVSFSLCCPSRATNITGQYAHNHGVFSNAPQFGGWQKFNKNGEERRALPLAMQRAGYNTSFVGRYLNGWGNGHDHPGARIQPPPPGWSSFIGLVGQSVYSMWGYTLDFNGSRQQLYPKTPTDQANYQTDVLGNIAANQIRQYARSPRPFMLDVWTTAPHTEENSAIHRGFIRPAPRYASALPNLQLHRTPSFNQADVSKFPPYIRNRPLLTPANIANMTRRNRARVLSLLSVDDLVANVVKTLRQTGRLKNTIIIYTSDNGWLFGQHRIFQGKYFPYSDSPRVPMVFSGPGIRRGATSNAVVANIDFTPTILRLAHATPLVQPDGISLLPILAGKTNSTNRDLLLENLDPNNKNDEEARGFGRYERYQAFRSSDWLYVVYEDPKQGIELFNLRKDPDNLHNLAYDPRYAAVRARLNARLNAIKSCAGASCRRGRLAY